MHFQYPAFILTSWLLVLISHMWMISYLYLLAFPFIIFLFPILGFFFFFTLRTSFSICYNTGLVVKNDKEPTCQCRRQDVRVWSPGREDPLEKGMATHANFLAWIILWTEEPGGLQSMRLQRVRHDLSTQTHMLTTFCTINTVACAIQ